MRGNPVKMKMRLIQQETSTIIMMLKKDSALQQWGTGVEAIPTGFRVDLTACRIVTHPVSEDRGGRGGQFIGGMDT